MLGFILVVTSTVGVAVTVLIVVQAVHYDHNAWLKNCPQKAPVRRK